MAEGDADAKAKAEAEAEDKAKADADAKAAADAKAKGGDTEGRISELVKKAKELEDKLKAKEEADKKREEEEAKGKGKHKELAEKMEKERDESLAKATSYEEKVKAYEEIAKAQVDAALKSITDDEKRKSVKALLEGLDAIEQLRKLPEVLKLLGQPAGGFGGNTPKGKENANTSDEQKRARFDEMTNRQLKGEKLTPQEEREYMKLSMELSAFIPKS